MEKKSMITSLYTHTHTCEWRVFLGNGRENKNKTKKNVILPYTHEHKPRLL